MGIKFRLIAMNFLQYAIWGSWLISLGAVVDAYGWPDSWFIFAGYALVVAVVFAVVFKYRHNPAEMGGVKH